VSASRTTTPLVSATIDTKALRHNLQAIRRHAPHSHVMAVIKANAYGHGLITVARALQAADSFAVARVDEGLALREAGVNNRVVLLEGVFDAQQLEAAAQARFELVVHTPEQIALLRSSSLEHSFPVWLKLDSGMNRLGFKSAQFREAHAALSTLPTVSQPVNLFTHLASADEPKVTTTHTQLQAFAAATEGLAGQRCIENSAGVLAFPQAHADWVRPGLLLYGVSPFAGSVGTDFGLQPVMTLRTQVIAVKGLAVGEHVGYGGTWVATRPTALAIAAVGYGDGYPRSLPSESPVLVNGQRAGLAGRVSMDMIAIDVSDLPSIPKLGDPVVLWGEGLPVEEVARNAQTIPYELLCGISQRVAVSTL
jgi:alanine racemase